MCVHYCNDYKQSSFTALQISLLEQPDENNEEQNVWVEKNKCHRKGHMHRHTLTHTHKNAYLNIGCRY